MSCSQCYARTKTLPSFFGFIQYFYLAGFAISLLSSKLIGIELISLVQLTYYCQIPFGVVDPAFAGLTQMTYVSGYNLKFPNLQQVPLPANLSNLGLSSNFLSDLNLMLLPAALCPIVFGLLVLGSNLSSSYKHKPRMKQYAVACLCEWSFTLILFSSYNIYVSLVADLQSLGIKDPLAIVIALFSGLLPVAMGVLYCMFKGCYEEFIGLLNQTTKIGGLSAYKSKFLCSLYPVALTVEMVLIPLFLANQLLLGCSLYIALAMTVVTTVFVALVMPYDEGLNNARLLTHRALMSLMVILLIFCKSTITPDIAYDSPLLNLVWVVVCILVLDLAVNVPFIIWKLVLWVKKEGVIDLRLFLEHKGRIAKL